MFFRNLLFLLFSCLLHAKLSACKASIDGLMLEGTCKGILKHGRFVGYYENGLLAWEVSYKNGYLHGVFRHYYPGGALHFQGEYRQSKLQGRFYQYDSVGAQSLRASFKDGLLHGWLYVFDNERKVEALKYYYGKLVRQEYID